MLAKKKQPSEDHIQEQRELIGKRIREFREFRGYSQDDLAAIMQVHRSTISKVEQGKFSITVDYLNKFAWFLDFQVVLKSNEG